MSIVYPTAIKTARMQAVADAIDAGSGVGRLEIGTAAMGIVLATIPLSKPCGAVAGAVLTLAGFPKSDTDADATGAAAAARIVDSDGNVCIGGLTVGTSAGDLRLAAQAIAQHQTVAVDSAVFTHAA